MTSTALAADLAAAVDPVALAQAAEIEPDPWQAEVLRSPASRVLLNCSRQSGKSTVAALLAVHSAVFVAQALVLMVSPSLRQSGELFRKALGVYRRLGRPVPAEAESALYLELENGSRIVSLPGNEHTLRGFSGVHLLVIDEAARVPAALYSSLRPMLAVSGGRLLALSTPYGARGWWWEAWAKGGDAWRRWEVPATSCRRISAEFLAEEQRALGDWWFQQEYLCQFLDAETAAFRREDVDGAFREEVDAWAL